jgi:hypothetical protein
VLDCWAELLLLTKVTGSVFGLADGIAEGVADGWSGFAILTSFLSPEASELLNIGRKK